MTAVLCWTNRGCWRDRHDGAPHKSRERSSERRPRFSRNLKIMAEPRPTEHLPMFPLRTVLVPGMPLSLNVFEPRYRKLVADLLNSGGDAAPQFGVVALRAGWE